MQCLIAGFHLMSRRPCRCSEQCSKISFGNLALLLYKTCGTIFFCFVHQHGGLVTWIKPKNIVFCRVIIRHYQIVFKILSLSSQGCGGQVVM